MIDEERKRKEDEEMLVAFVSILVLMMVAVPLALGFGGALALRRAGLKWTFGIPLVLVGLLVLLEVGPVEALRNVGGALGIESLRTEPGGGDRPYGKVILDVSIAALPFWIPLTGVFVCGYKLWLDRRAVLRGGASKREVEAAMGPVDLLKRRRACRRVYREPLMQGGELWIGSDLDTGEPVTIRLPTITHVLGPGASRLGKTHDQMLVGDAARALGWGRITVDPKCDPDYAARELKATQASRHGFQLFSLQPFGRPELDEYRVPFVVLGHGTATQVKDAFVFAQEWESPHYRAIVERAVQAAADAQLAAGQQPNLRRTGRLLREPGLLASGLNQLDAGRYAEQARWLETLQADEVSALRGAANRCGRLAEGDGGEVLLPIPGIPELDMYGALLHDETVHLAVDCDSYPELGPQVIAFLLAGLLVAVSELRAEEYIVDALACIDEAGALSGEQGRALLERCGDIGVRTWWAPQSLNAIEAVAGSAMRDALIDNCDVVLAHRQSGPEAAELLASLGGTVEDLEHTHVVDDRLGPLGFDESGLRSRRLVERFQAHPNRIKRLQRGEALLIEKGMALSARFVAMRKLIPTWLFRGRALCTAIAER